MPLGVETQAWLMKGSECVPLPTGARNTTIILVLGINECPGSLTCRIMARLLLNDSSAHSPSPLWKTPSRRGAAASALSRSTSNSHSPPRADGASRRPHCTAARAGPRISPAQCSSKSRSAAQTQVTQRVRVIVAITNRLPSNSTGDSKRLHLRVRSNRKMDSTPNVIVPSASSKFRPSGLSIPALGWSHSDGLSATHLGKSINSVQMDGTEAKWWQSGQPRWVSDSELLVCGSFLCACVEDRVPRACSHKNG
jgi:hypothetical protein